ncbi:hypothetical protein D3C81_1373500 [compost metagenome]
MTAASALTLVPDRPSAAGVSAAAVRSTDCMAPLACARYSVLPSLPSAHAVAAKPLSVALSTAVSVPGATSTVNSRLSPPPTTSAATRFAPIAITQACVAPAVPVRSSVASSAPAKAPADVVSSSASRAGSAAVAPATSATIRVPSPFAAMPKTAVAKLCVAI